MALYAIGDVQGCYDDLQRLLDKIRFDASKDQLWFVGDLVNRGDRSVDVLRLVMSLGNRAETVLGNHDLHLLALALGVRDANKKDTLDEILEAPDCDKLLHWLRHQPLLVEHPELNYVMVHAGIHPHWTLTQAKARANEVEQVLRGQQYSDFLHNMYGNQPNSWDDALQGWDRLRMITNVFTRMRYCTKNGSLDAKCKGAPTTQSKGLRPWFERLKVKFEKQVIFGHWSTLGIYQDQQVLGLDSGCLWGGCLTAARLSRGNVKLTSVKCTAKLKPS